MHVRLLFIAVFISTIDALSAQSPTGRLEFEVASVKPAPSGFVPVLPQSDGSLVNIRSISLANLICRAYRQLPDEVIAPDWVSTTYFALNAKLPAGASVDQVPEMLQALLSDRFGLSVHRETKTQTVYVLLLSKKGSNLTQSSSGAVGSIRPSTVNGHVRYRMSSIELSKFAELLRGFLGKPVVDMTGLNGAYDFDFELAARKMRQGAPNGQTTDSGPGMPAPEDLMLEVNASLDPLGLRLQSRKSPTEVLVVDHAERTPTAN